MNFNLNIELPFQPWVLAKLFSVRAHLQIRRRKVGWSPTEADSLQRPLMLEDQVTIGKNPLLHSYSVYCICKLDYSKIQQTFQ